MIKTTTTSLFLLLLIGQAFSQTTFTSVGSGSFATTGASVWSPSPIASDFTDGLNTFIVADGDVITVDGGSTITISAIEVGQGGGTGTLTIGNSSSAASLTLNGSLVIQSGSIFQTNNNDGNTHTLSIASDVVNNGGTFDLENGTGLANTTLANTATTVLSGSTMVFNDLTANGGGGVILIAALDVNGNFVADMSGTDVTTSSNHNFAGDFTLSNSATFTATSSTIFFDGAGAQALGFSGGSASFNNVTFNNSTKTVTGNLISDGTFEITATATWSNTGGSHQLATLEVKNASGVAVTSGTITFTGGTLRFGDGTGTVGVVDPLNDGSFTLGTSTNIIFDGNCFVQRDDQITVDGDVTITSAGFLVLNGASSSPAVGESDSELNVTGARTLTLEGGADLFLRGYDNFPVDFTTYTLDLTSLVRHDGDFDQLIVGENSANVTIPYGRLYLSQDDASVQRTRQLITGDDDLQVNGQFDMINGVQFLVTHTANLEFGEDIRADDGTTAGSPVFSATSSTVTMDANINQVLDGPVAGSYDVDSWIITNTATPTTVRTVFVDDNVAIDVAFTVTNPNGTSANTLIVDLDENQIFGVNGGLGESFTLGANTTIYTSTNDVEGFAEDFGDAGDVVTLDQNSIVRFDRAGDQTMPNFNGGTFGTIQFTGSGNRFIPADGFTPVALTILGDVTRIGGTPVFRFGSLADVFQASVNHSVAGDWNLATAYTGDDETNGGAADVVITFNGADQNISASDFGSVVFAGTGTKTITGTQLIDRNVTINTGVTVNAGSEAIDVGGDWTESGTAVFTQTGNVTDFNGGIIQNITTNSGSFFDLVRITNSSNLTLNSTIEMNDDLDIESGSTVTIEGQTVRVGGELYARAGATIAYTDPTTSIVVMDGTTEQNFRNLNAQTYPSLQFEGVGNKELINNDLTVEGNLTIAAESTFQGNSLEINFQGDTWTNNGNFQHNNSVNFLNAGGTTSVSTSSFHDIEIGMSDGSVTTTVNLAGNITLNGEMNIFANASLDVSASNFAITVEEDWNNYGVFNARSGNVTFTGGESDFRSFSLTVSNSGAQADKAFYDLTVNNDAGSRFDVEQEGVVLNDQIDVLNDLTIATGIFRLVEDDGDADPGPALLNVGGSLINNGNGFEFRQENARIALNGTSGTHSVNLGGDQVRDFEINASGATYQLTGDFLMRDDADNALELSAGTLDLNGNILTVNRGGLDMSGGTLIVDEGASLLLNDLAVDPDFNKTGGNLQIVGVDGNPATLSSTDVGGFTFTQTLGDFEAQFYTIANTTGDGIRLEGGTIDTGASGNDFSNGTFTSGAGNAYLTLAPSTLNNTSANNVVFNEGPTHNVSLTDLATAHTVEPTIEFVIAGGTLAGAQDEEDNPDGVATTGYIRWSEDPGFTWTGGAGTTAWNTAGNWNDTSGDADGIPDSDDIIYIEDAAFDPVIGAGEVFSVARVTVRNSGVLTFTGDGSLSVSGNFTVFSGCAVDMSASATSTLNIGGAWASAGTFNEGTATVTFNGTSGTHSITTLGNTDPFYNLVINGAGATYTLGSIMTVTNAFTLSDGTFDGSSGFDLFINNDWTVNGGTFSPGQGRVRFNGTSGTQNISGGTIWDALFEGAAAKSIDGNISVADDFIIAAGSGVVSGNDRTIFVGGDWDLDEPAGFDPGTGTVIFNGTAGQNLEADDTQPITFNNIIFQNAGQKDFEFTTTVTGDMSIISENTFVDMETGSTLAITGTLSQTGGNFRIFNSNFPTAGAYNFTGGEVDFLQDGALSIPSGITFNDLEIRSLSGGAVATTATLGGDITVNDDINFSTGAVTFDVSGHTITLGDAIFLSDDEVLTWGATGTLIHTGAFWNMDADFNTSTRAFQNLTLNGTSAKRPNSDIAVNGNLTVGDGVELEQLTRAITNDGGDAFVMQQNSILDTRVVGTAFPTGFASYSLDATSRVDLQASGNQTIFTNSGTLEYGALRIFTTGTATLDGNLTVQGDFDMNANPTLADGGFNMTLNGEINDIQDYTPTAATTVTFSRAGDQTIFDNDGSGQDLVLENVVFGGSGTKTLQPNAADEVSDIAGTVTINSGVTVTTARGVEFSGTSWTNNGTFNLTVNSRPFVFDGGNTTIDPGTNEIAALTVSNSAATTVTVQTNGFDLGTGDFNISANAAIDFSNLTHNIASENVNIDAAGSWILTGATLDFDQNGGQNIPPIDQGNANITGAPSIITSTAGNKLLTSNVVVNDVTIGLGTDLDAINLSNHQITVNGNWTNNGGDFFEREGTVVFNSDDTNPKTITSNGEDFATVIFQGTMVRTYTLQDNMQVEGNTSGAGLTLASATLDLNGNILTLGDNDTGDPDAELNVIGSNGTLEVDAGATLQFDTFDDGGDLADTEIGGNLDVQSGGVLSIVGTSGNLATVTRSAGAERIDINIESGGEIGAQFYSLQYLTDEGLEVEDGATVNATNNFLNGTFSNLATDAGNGTGGDDNPIAGNRYLTIESDAALTIDNVTFNFDGSPTVGQHYNVTRSNAGGNLAITFTNSSGPLARNGAVYEEDGDATAPAHSNGQLRWDLPVDTRWTGATSTDWSTASNWDNGVPSIALNDREAIIDLGSPFNPTIETGDGTVNISALIINDGILKVVSSGVLDLDGDLTLGDGTGGALIMDNTSTVNVQGSWTTSANAIFDNGDGTVTFDAPSGSAVSISPGDQAFYNVTMTNGAAAGEFNMVAADLDINGNLVIANSATFIPATAGYDFTIAGNITASGGSFDTTVDGEVILDGAAQTLTDMSFDELTVAGTGTKTTSGTTVINDNLIINSGTILSGGGAITMSGDVQIDGTFNGVASQTYTFEGDDWIAAPSSYTGDGTVEFNRSIGGTQYIRQSIDGNNPVEFNNLTFSGTAQIQLGRLIGGDQDDGNVNLTGNLTVNNTINQLDVNNYLIDSDGTGTMTLADGEFIRVEGANNFPSDFSVYDLADGSFTLYYGTIDQTIRGGVTYGNLYLNLENTKTLGGNIDVDGNLQFFNSATLDASASNYSINLAGRWDTNSGNADGSFIARAGTVTFDGGADQILDIGETGTQAFNDILVNKSGGNVEVATSNITIGGNVNVFNGTFDLNNLIASIAGNMNASGTGQYASGGIGTYFLNATSGTPTIGTNGSVINGNIQIDATGRTYELVSDVTILGGLTVTAGTLDVNGQTLSVGDFEDVVDIFGTLNVSTASKPGGTLALGNDVQLVVQPGGTFNLVGTSSMPATLTSTGTTDYLFNVTGTGGSPGNIGARFYVIEYTGTDGIFINDNTLINTTNNFSDGTFQNGFAGGRYLRIENTQDLTGGNRIENIVFDDNPGGGASNIYKATAVSGNIELFNYSGGFSGEDFDQDPNDLITWLAPPTVTWTGTVSNDWFTTGNWDSGTVPTASQDVIIPQVLNEPIITDNVSVAVANNLTIQVNAKLEVNTTDVDAVDLQIAGDLTFEASASFESSGSDDDIEIGGSWLRLSSALFTKGTSQVTFTSLAGTETIDNNDGFYDLIVNVVGTTTLSTDLTVDNDLTITSGTLDFNASDVTVVGNLSNSGTITPQTRTLSLIPNNTTTRTFNPGTSELYNLTIGEAAGSSAEYDLSNNLTVNHDFNLVVGTLDPNTNNLNLGNDDATQDDVNIAGTILVEANETVSLGDDAVVLIQSGGDFRLNGTDLSNAASMTRRSSGAYDFTVQSGGTFEASNFLMEHMAGEGIWIQSGATLVGMSSGTFQNGGNASYYLRLSNAFASDITSTEITFNVGPTNNVRRNEAAGNNLILQDAGGAFAGPTFELDDASATTGEIRWTYTNPLTVWTGALSDDWHLAGNWDNGIPSNANTVQIPDVSAGSNRYPIISSSAADAASLTIFSGASLTLTGGQTLDVVNELANSGTLTIIGSETIDVGDSWTNNGTFNPGTSTITLSSGVDVTVSGGASFYNLVIDGAGTGAGIVFSSSEMLDVNNNFTITDGVYEITDAAHTLTVGGNFIVDATNGSFVDNVSTVTLDGTAQDLGNAGGTTLSFNNLILSGSGIKTARETLDVNGDLSINSGVTLALVNETLNFSGSSFDVDGSLDVSGGTSTVNFDGSEIQIITGNAGATTFDNLVITNTAVGNSDVQLNITTSVNTNANFVTGIVQSSGSNPLTFNDNSTVSYDGVLEITPTGGTNDGNSYAVGPVVKIGDDAFVFPIGDGSLLGRMGISGFSGTPTATDQYSAEFFFSTVANRSATLNGGMVRVSSLEYWDLSNLNGHGSQPQVTLFWNGGSEVTNTATLTVAHYNGTSWDNQGNGGTTGDENGGTITSSVNLTSFSPITLASTDADDNPLPVELLDFRADLEDNVVTLHWSTASELNNDRFDLYRSLDGVEFELVGSVAGAGNSSDLNEYRFVDDSPASGVSYYRLTQVDFDGTVNEQGVIRISNDFYQAGIETTIYPNPADLNNLNLNISTGDNHTPIKIELTDISGKVYYERIVSPSFKTTEKIDVEEDLSSGVYFLKVQQGENSSVSRVIIR